MLSRNNLIYMVYIPKNLL